MKKYAKLLCVALLSISLSFSLAAAEPSQCENCGQKRMFIVSCGAFSRWSKNQLHVQTTINARKERLYIRRYILVLTAAGVPFLEHMSIW